MITAYCCCRGSAEEHQISNDEVRNSFLPDVSWAVEFVSSCVSAVLGGLLGPRPVSQCSYLDVDPNVKSHTVIYKQIVRRGTMTPYEFKFYDPAHVITGIACGPQDDKTSSPDAEVVDGGIGCHHVVIRLSPVQKGRWACSIEISGTEGNSVHMT
jgi:hypothetical protein